MKHLILPFAALILLSCNNSNIETAVGIRDTSQTDSSLIKVNSILLNPFRDMNNFDIKVGNPFIDSLHNVYTKSTNPELITDLCSGDYCQSYQTFKNNDGSEFYFFKSESGEYGFSNDQYLLKNDSILYARNFIAGIEKWPTDSTRTLWIVREITFEFTDNGVSCMKREVFTENLYEFDYTLKDVPKQEIKSELNKTYNDVQKELNELLSFKDSEHLD